MRQYLPVRWDVAKSRRDIGEGPTTESGGEEIETMRYEGMRAGWSGGMKFAVATTLATIAMTEVASAGGFDIREQSAYYQGMSFAGSAAGGSLSSMFWNPAGAGTVGKGFTFESTAALILPDSEITVTSLSGPGAGLVSGLDNEVDIGLDAVVPATYAAWRGDIDPRLVFAVSINSQFGLGTEPDNANWAGKLHAQTAKLMSFNVAPTASYEVMPGVIVGAGIQFQYFDLKRFKAAVPLTTTSSSLEGTDFDVGFTAGILLKPAKGTSIGLGFRSSVDHDLSGSVNALGFSSAVHADIETPEKVTLSFEQAFSSNLRATGTVEWTNWSRLEVVPVVLDAAFLVLPAGSTVANLDFQWHDGWFFALGGEYDVNSKLTVRAGGAYEISPIQNASERLLQLPDADRIWASIGASYRWNETFTFDFAYSHIFVEDADISRLPSSVTSPPVLLTGEADSSVDIISASVKSHW